MKTNIYLIIMAWACLISGQIYAFDGNIITKIIRPGLKHPLGIAVDTDGNAYLTGRASNNAFKISPTGFITEIINSTGDGMGNRLTFPESIAVDTVGNVYVAGGLENDNSSNAFKITPSGAITQIIDFTGDGAGNRLEVPSGIAVDSVGHVYVIGSLSDNAFKITPQGQISQIIGPQHGLDNPNSITVDSVGNVYITGLHSDNAFKISPTGAIFEIIDAVGDGIGNALDAPIGIAVDDVGAVYVAGGISENIFKIEIDGDITQIAEEYFGSIAVDSGENICNRSRPSGD